LSFREALNSVAVTVDKVKALPAPTYERVEQYLEDNPKLSFESAIRKAKTEDLEAARYAEMEDLEAEWEAEQTDPPASNNPPDDQPDEPDQLDEDQPDDEPDEDQPADATRNFAVNAEIAEEDLQELQKYQAELLAQDWPSEVADIVKAIGKLNIKSALMVA